MSKSNTIRISLPPNTYEKTITFAKHIDCISGTGNPQPSDAIRRTFRIILNLYADEDFQKCVENEGIDTLAFIQRCVKKGMKESLKENR